MKKLLFVCISVLLVLSVCTGCVPLLFLGDTDEEQEKPPIVSTQIEPQKQDAPVEAPEVEETQKQEEQEQTEDVVSIQEQVIVDQDGVKITASEYIPDPIWGDGIKLLIENNSSINIHVSCKALVVNNYIINEAFVSSVAAGKKVYEELRLSADHLEAAGISEAGQIEVSFLVYDDDAYDTIFSTDLITIKTSAYDNMEIVANDEGTELYNADGIRIIGKYVDDDAILGTAVQLYLENTTNRNIRVTTENMSVNGFMVDEGFICYLYAGKMAIDNILILSSSLEENGIVSIEDIELSFRIIDEDTYDLIVETNPICFQLDNV